MNVFENAKRNLNTNFGYDVAMAKHVVWYYSLCVRVHNRGVPRSLCWLRRGFGSPKPSASAPDQDAHAMRRLRSRAGFRLRSPKFSGHGWRRFIGFGSGCPRRHHSYLICHWFVLPTRMLAESGAGLAIASVSSQANNATDALFSKQDVQSPW